MRNQADATAYYWHKIIAEQAAWDSMAAGIRGLKLIAILPGLVLAPVQKVAFNNSVNKVFKLLNSSLNTLSVTKFMVMDGGSVTDLLRRDM